MNTMDYLRYVVETIHTTVVATVDDNGLPVTAAIDMMDYDEDGLFFLTAEVAGSNPVASIFYWKIKGF